MIKEIAGGEHQQRYCRHLSQSATTARSSALTFAFLKKLSGKEYAAEQVANHFSTALDLILLHQTEQDITVAVPYSKPDIALPADIVEEIVRIDGLDNIAIPSTIRISPAMETLGFEEIFKEKISQQLAGLGFYEIVTNSITNSKYYNDEVLKHSVKMINNLSADLDVLRPSMLQTGLEAIVYNVNSKNTNLQFFEWGKTYHQKETGNYYETEHLSLIYYRCSTRRPLESEEQTI